MESQVTTVIRHGWTWIGHRILLRLKPRNHFLFLVTRWVVMRIYWFMSTMPFSVQVKIISRWFIALFIMQVVPCFTRSSMAYPPIHNLPTQLAKIRQCVNVSWQAMEATLYQLSSLLILPRVTHSLPVACSLNFFKGLRSGQAIPVVASLKNGGLDNNQTIFCLLGRRRNLWPVKRENVDYSSLIV